MSVYSEKSAALFQSLPDDKSAYTSLELDFNDLISKIQSPVDDVASDSASVSIKKISEHGFHKQIVSPDESKLVAFNFANFNSGSLVTVERNANATITRNFIAKGASVSRNVFVVGKGSEVVVVENLVSAHDNSFVSDVAEFFVEDNAKLTIFTLQDFSDQATFVSSRKAMVGRNSSVFWRTLNVGSKISKCSRNTMLNSSGASLDDVEVVLAKGSQHIDSSITASHTSPHTQGRVSVRGVLGGSARQVAYGNVFIGKDARGAISFLEEHSILLSKDAKADSIPALEILTNDVSAKHAATCTQVDDERLFYLTARGLDNMEARRLVVNGFINSQISLMPERFQKRGEEWLQSLSF